MNADRKSNLLRENLVRAKKRHFDSRWRANIASCFETLLNIIPISKRANRKQSKANILEATAEHLTFLEASLVSLLTEKAERESAPDIQSFCSANMDHIKCHFIHEQTLKPRRSMRCKPSKYRKRKFTKGIFNTGILLGGKHLSHPSKNESPKVNPPTEIANSTLICNECVSDDEGICNCSGLEETPKILSAVHSGSAKNLKFDLSSETRSSKRCRRTLDKEFEMSLVGDNMDMIDSTNTTPQVVTDVCASSVVGSDWGSVDVKGFNIKEEKFDLVYEKYSIELEAPSSAALMSLAPSQYKICTSPIKSDSWMVSDYFPNMIPMQSLKQENEDADTKPATTLPDNITSTIKQTPEKTITEDYIGRYSPLFNGILEF